MLIDAYQPEDVFARVPELAAQIDPVLQALDSLLEDDQLYQQIRADLGQRYHFTLVHGRHSTPVEVILRLLICKHLYQWSYKETEERVKDSLVLRWFCRVYFARVPDETTVLRWLRTLRPETLHALNDRVVELAAEITKSLGDYEGEPVVIFTQFRGVQEALIQRLQAVGIYTWELNGDTPKQARTDVVKQWGSAPQPGALVAMLQVAGVGLNMTQASKCIFVDKLFVPKLNEQAEDRLHRIGASTTQPIQVYEMIVKNSIESRIETILRRKTKLFNTLVETGDWKKMLYEAMLEEEEE